MKCVGKLPFVVLLMFASNGDLDARADSLLRIGPRFLDCPGPGCPAGKTGAGGDIGGSGGAIIGQPHADTNAAPRPRLGNACATPYAILPLERALPMGSTCFVDGPDVRIRGSVQRYRTDD